MSFVLDSTAFFTEWRAPGPCITTPNVVEELRDTRSKMRYEVFLAEGLEVRAPSSTDHVRSAMQKSGDAGVLSATDIGLLALALEVGGTLVTDDFALQNVACRLDIPVQPIHQRRAEARTWRYRCTGCGRYGKDTGPCPVCGSPMKRTIR